MSYNTNNNVPNLNYNHQYKKTTINKKRKLKFKQLKGKWEHHSSGITEPAALVYKNLLPV